MVSPQIIVMGVVAGLCELSRIIGLHPHLGNEGADAREAGHDSANPLNGIIY